MLNAYRSALRVIIFLIANACSALQNASNVLPRITAVVANRDIIFMRRGASLIVHKEHI